MRFAYYPGCSLKGTGKAYEKSTLAVFKALGLELIEIPEWNCCGATAYMAVDELASEVLSFRNLVLAQRMGLQRVVAPCSACYLNLLKARKAFLSNDPKRERLCSALKRAGWEYDCSALPEVLHPLQVFTEIVGLEKIKERIRRPLKGLKIVPYYGCQLVRPYDGYDDPIYPVKMDLLLELTGAEIISDYPLKTRCCGASLTGTIEEAGVRLNELLITEAKRRGGNVMSTLCALCQFNLEMYQGKMKVNHKMPVLYFTQILGLALGLGEKELGMEHLLYRPSLEV